MDVDILVRFCYMLKTMCLSFSSDVADENDTWENLFDDEDDECLNQSVGDEVGTVV